MHAILPLVVTKKGEAGAAKKGGSVADLAIENKIPLLAPEKIDEKAIAAFTSYPDIDIAVLAAYGNIIPKTLLSWPTHGWINVHPSLLPKFRGPSPIQSTILQGEKMTGVTLIQMDDGIDSGPIIAQANHPISEDDTAITLMDALAQCGAELLQKNILPYYQKKITPQAQNGQTATYTKKIARGNGRIDWMQPAEHIARQIRAYHPWPGSWTTVDKYRLEILAGAYCQMSKQMEPGTLLLHNGKLLIAAGHQSGLELQQLQIAGKRPCGAQEFLNGYHRLLGLRCGV